MTEILITGNQGQLGKAIERLANNRGLGVSGSDLDSLDITNASQIEEWVGDSNARTLINCAAFTAVDDCETNEKEAEAINGTAVGFLAEACHKSGTRLIHVSTDYVFDGTKATPYVESDPTGPTSAYGRTKLAGERLAASVPDHVIVRTAWLYGLGGNNFVEAIRRQIDGGAEELKVVADQHGCPTFCDDLASAMLDLAEVDAQGIFHVVNSGETTWHGFASEVARLLGSNIPIEPVTTQAFPRPAPRPAYSVLDTTKVHTLLGRPMPTWQDALTRYLQS